MYFYKTSQKTQTMKLILIINMFGSELTQQNDTEMVDIPNRLVVVPSPNPQIKIYPSPSRLSVMGLDYVI